MKIKESLGASILDYFNDKRIKLKCKKCGTLTSHEEEEKSLMISSTVLSFSIQRFDTIDRKEDKFNYPQRINFMGNFSSEYQPTYELFAIIVNRGISLYKREEHKNYVTIVKRENGEVIEFDPEAGSPKKLSDPNLML